MKTLSTMVAVLMAAFMISCGGNANRPAEVTEETQEVEMVVTTDEACTEECEGAEKCCEEAEAVAEAAE